MLTKQKCTWSGAIPTTILLLQHHLQRFYNNHWWSDWFCCESSIDGRDVDIFSTLTNIFLRVCNESAHWRCPICDLQILFDSKAHRSLERLLFAVLRLSESCGQNSIDVSLSSSYDSTTIQWNGYRGNFSDKGSAEPRILWIQWYVCSICRLKCTRVQDFLDSRTDGSSKTRVFANFKIHRFSKLRCLWWRIWESLHTWMAREF